MFRNFTKIDFEAVLQKALRLLRHCEESIDEAIRPFCLILIYKVVLRHSGEGRNRIVVATI